MNAMQVMVKGRVVNGVIVVHGEMPPEGADVDVLYLSEVPKGKPAKKPRQFRDADGNVVEMTPEELEEFEELEQASIRADMLVERLLAEDTNDAG